MGKKIPYSVKAANEVGKTLTRTFFLWGCLNLFFVQNFLGNISGWVQSQFVHLTKGNHHVIIKEWPSLGLILRPLCMLCLSHGMLLCRNTFKLFRWPNVTEIMLIGKVAQSRILTRRIKVSFRMTLSSWFGWTLGKLKSFSGNQSLCLSSVCFSSVSAFLYTRLKKSSEFSWNGQMSQFKQL